MLNRLRNLFRKRSYEAAAGGRRWDTAGTVGNWNSAILVAAPTTRLRGRHAFANNAWLTAGVTALVSSLAGTGIRPRAQHPDPDVRERLHELWTAWVRRADADGLTDFYGLQNQIARAMIVSGEVFALVRIPQLIPGGPVPLQLQLADAEQCDAALHRDLDSGRRVRAGIEFAADGRRIAYHMPKARPGDLAVAGPPGHTKPPSITGARVLMSKARGARPRFYGLEWR